MAEEFSDAERAYFTSRGEMPIPTSEAAPASPPEPEPPAEPPPVKDEPAAPSEAAIAADKEPPVQDLKEDRRVPVGELQEERKRRKDVEERLRQSEVMQARMEERFKAFLDRGPQQPQQPQRPPRADQDIFATVNYLQQELGRRGQEIDGYKERMASEERAKQIQNWADGAQNEFSKANPDYYEALEFTRQGRARELVALGFTGTTVRDQINAEERGLMSRAMQLKKNPAVMAYEMAVARGYKKAAPAANPAAHLERVEAGQKQSGSMSNVGGKAAPTGEVTLADLVKMTDMDFLAFKAKHPAKYRRLKGAEH